MATGGSAAPLPLELWKSLSPERKLVAAAAFWQDDGALAEQAEAVTLIAQRIKFRPKSVLSMSADRKARRLAALAGLSEAVAARLLVSYHLEQQRPLMSRFLDLLEIPHEDGLISEEEFAAPSADQLRVAAQTLAAEYPPEDVALYFSTLRWQDPETWGELAELRETFRSAPTDP